VVDGLRRRRPEFRALRDCRRRLMDACAGRRAGLGDTEAIFSTSETRVAANHGCFAGGQTVRAGAASVPRGASLAGEVFAPPAVWYECV
jgi:hypothetical protein